MSHRHHAPNERTFNPAHAERLDDLRVVSGCHVNVWWRSYVCGPE